MISGAGGKKGVPGHPLVGFRERGDPFDSGHYRSGRSFECGNTYDLVFHLDCGEGSRDVDRSPQLQVCQLLSVPAGPVDGYRCDPYAITLMPMKTNAMKHLLLIPALIFGGLVLILPRAGAQTGNTLVSAPQNNKAWVDGSTAKQTVSVEMTALGLLISQKEQQGASPAEIAALKYRLFFYTYMDEALNSGNSVPAALDYAREMLVRPDAIGYDAGQASKVQELYTEISLKFIK